MEGEEAEYVIREVHEGVCGTHIGGRALTSKIARAGYYWPTLRNDCMDYVRKCEKCQRFAEGHKAPPEHLRSITSPWPFCKWGVDILGPFLVALGQMKFIIMAIDYFTKWVEVEPFATISSEKLEKANPELDSDKSNMDGQKRPILGSTQISPIRTARKGRSWARLE
ncbi:Gypsy retrotransposon integrase-like protein 1, partial [Mucuna pruriens]